MIKYVPYVGDSKRAMDEYTSEIMMGGKLHFWITTAIINSFMLTFMKAESNLLHTPN